MVVLSPAPADGSIPHPPAVEIRGEADVPSGDIADYALYSLNPFADGASIDIKLNAIGVNAQPGVDFFPILASSLTPFEGLSLSAIATDPSNNALAFSVTNASGLELPAGYQLLTFPVETRRVSQQQQPSKSFYVQLDTPNNAPQTSSLITTISDGNGPAPRVDIVAPPLISSGEINTYGLYLADKWPQGGLIQLTLNATGGSAQTGVDYEPLSIASFLTSPGTSIFDPVTNPATGAISFLLENSSIFDLQAGDQLLTFTLQTLRSSPAEAQKTVNIELETAGNALKPSVFTTTIATPAPLRGPRIELVGKPSVDSGEALTYALYLTDPFAADGSVDISLNAIGGTAELGVDFAALRGRDLTASPGLMLSPVVTNPLTGELSLSIGNTSGADLQAGDQLLTFTLQTLRSSPAAAEKTVNIELETAANALNPTVLTTTIVTPAPLLSPRIELVGQATVKSGSESMYSLYLTDPFEAGGSVDIKLNAIGRTAELGVDFKALMGTALVASPGIMLSPVVSNPATGELSLSAKNTSGYDLQPGDQLLKFPLQTLNAPFSQWQKTVDVQLTTASNTIKPTVLTTSIITQPPVIAPSDTGDANLAATDVLVEEATDPFPLELGDPGFDGGGDPFGAEEQPNDLSIARRIQLNIVIRGEDGADDDVIGSPYSDVIGNGRGAKLMVGDDGADGFLFDTASFKPSDVDVIADFDPTEDSIWLDPSTFPRIKKQGIKFKSVNSLQRLDRLAKQGKANLYHLSTTGELYYDHNGAKSGFGKRGGLFGGVDGERTLMEEDFFLAPQGAFDMG